MSEEGAEVMSEEITALSIAHGLEDIYDSFTQSVRELGKKHGRKGKLGASVVHWLAGSHVKTERDLLCEKFLKDVQDQLSLLDAALEDAPKEEMQEALAVAADVLSTPVSPNSNATTDLMKRAVISQLRPYLPKLSEEKLRQIKGKMEAAYLKRQRLPVERDILKDIDTLLK